MDEGCVAVPGTESVYGGGEADRMLAYPSIQPPPLQNENSIKL